MWCTGCAEFDSSWTLCCCSGSDGDTGQVMGTGQSCEQRNFWSDKAVSQGGSCSPAGCPGRAGNLCSWEILKARLAKALSSLLEGDSAQGGFRWAPKHPDLFHGPDTLRQAWGCTLVVLVPCIECPNLTVPWAVFPADPLWRNKSAWCWINIWHHWMISVPLLSCILWILIWREFYRHHLLP